MFYFKCTKKKHGLFLGERWIWFRYAFEEDKIVATKPEMHELVEAYLVRHDDEIAELEQERYKGHKKPKGPRQDQLEALKISENNEYISGIGKMKFIMLKGEILTF